MIRSGSAGSGPGSGRREVVHEREALGSGFPGPGGPGPLSPSPRPGEEGGEAGEEEGGLRGGGPLRSDPGQGAAGGADDPLPAGSPVSSSPDTGGPGSPEQRRGVPRAGVARAALQPLARQPGGRARPPARGQRAPRRVPGPAPAARRHPPRSPGDRAGDAARRVPEGEAEEAGPLPARELPRPPLSPGARDLRPHAVPGAHLHLPLPGVPGSGRRPALPGGHRRVGGPGGLLPGVPAGGLPLPRHRRLPGGGVRGRGPARAVPR